MSDISIEDLLEIEPEELLTQMEEINIEPDMDDLLECLIEETKEIWDTKKAANYLGVTNRTISNYVHKGLLKPVCRGSGKRMYFSNHDVEELYKDMLRKKTIVRKRAAERDLLDDADILWAIDNLDAIKRYEIEELGYPYSPTAALLAMVLYKDFSMVNEI